jgi:16S rRNA processing protein RimM
MAKQNQTKRKEDTGEELIPVARISKLFGTGGGVVINLYDTFPSDYDIAEPMFAVVDGLEVPFYPEKFNRRGRAGALVEFADIDTPERAAEFTGMELSLRYEPAQEQEGGEVYLEDLVGFSARFEGNDLRGTIVGFVDNEHNPLFTVSIDGREVFIPAVDEMVSGFDPGRREVTFDLPEGLLELYL